MAMKRIYHPELKRAVTVPEASAEVLRSAGWRSAAEAEPEPEPPEPPADSALKADWVDWAVEAGMDRDEAETLTKSELQELQPGPLAEKE